MKLKLKAGEARAVTLAATLYCCARCDYRGCVVADGPGEPAPAAPGRCPACNTRTWRDKVPRPAGRPRKGTERTATAGFKRGAA
jgi:hypothetical protein